MQKISKHSCNLRKKKTQVNFYLKEISIEDTLKENLKLNDKKASQNSDILNKIIKKC